MDMSDANLSLATDRLTACPAEEDEAADAPMFDPLSAPFDPDRLAAADDRAAVPLSARLPAIGRDDIAADRYNLSEIDSMHSGELRACCVPRHCDLARIRQRVVLV